jgi:hypothetical protein
VLALLAAGGAQGARRASIPFGPSGLSQPWRPSMPSPKLFRINSVTEGHALVIPYKYGHEARLLSMSAFSLSFDVSISVLRDVPSSLVGQIQEQTLDSET